MRNLLMVLAAVASASLLTACIGGSNYQVHSNEQKRAAINAEVENVGHKAADPNTVPNWCNQVGVRYEESFSGQQSSAAPGYSNRIRSGVKCQPRTLTRPRSTDDLDGWSGM